MTRDRLGLVVARELVAKCAAQFRMYAEEHNKKALKAIEDGDAGRAAESAIKSGVNGNFAKECDKFLADSAHVNDESEV